MHSGADNKLHEHTRTPRGRFLIYNGMRLIPFQGWSGLSDKWHLPGGEIASTSDLIDRAERRDVVITIIE